MGDNVPETFTIDLSRYSDSISVNWTDEFMSLNTLVFTLLLPGITYNMAFKRRHQIELNACHCFQTGRVGMG